MNFNFQRMVEIICDNSDKFKMYPGGYSGRVMYGRKGVGVTIKGYTSEYEFIGELFSQVMMTYGDVDEISDAIEQMTDIIKETRVDSLGLDRIMYWPDVKYEEDLDDEEIEEEEEEPEEDD